MNEIKNKIKPPETVYLDKTRGFVLEVMRFLRLRFKLIIACCIISLAVSFVMCYRQAPVYKATAKIRVTPRLRTFRPTRLQQFSKMYNIHFYYSQYILLHSYTIIKRVVQRLDLARKMSPYDNYVLPEEIAINILSGAIRIDYSEDMDVLSVSAFMKDRKLAAEVVNTYVDVYEEYMQKHKRDQIAETLAELQIKIDESNTLLEASEKRLEDVKRKRNLTFVKGINIDKVKLERYNRQYLDTKIERITTEVELSKIRILSQEAQANLILLKREYANLINLRLTFLIAEIRLASLQSSFGDKHPDVREAKEVKAEVFEKINKEISGIITGMEIELKVLKAKEEYLEKLTQAAREEIKSIDDAELEYYHAERDVNVNKEIYTELRKEYIKQMSLLELPEELVAVVDSAMAPSQDDYLSPDYIRSLSISFFSMLGLGILFVVLYGFLEKHIYNSARERAFSVLSVIPNTISTIDKVQHDSVQYESFRVIVNKLLLGEAKGVRSVLITSGAAGEGKTTVAANLAIVLGDSGKRILVIDANLRKPDMPAIFNIEPPELGLKNIEQFSRTPKKLIVPFVYPSIDLLPAGQGQIQDNHIISHKTISKLLEKLFSEYDCIIIDGPPLIGFGDSLILADVVDGVIVVEVHKKFTHSASALINESLKLTKANLLGTVLNSVSSADETYKYYYQVL
ncbi:MAG: polysaccharide biosynthesis tyrosine autokinase [bacterium]|nr:polysaccharide biosynthesis tyrosine autokinase [bacterium]